MVYRKWVLVVGVVLTLSAFPAKLFSEQEACSPTSYVSDAAGPVYSRDGEVLWETEPGARYCIAGIGELPWILIHQQQDPSSLGWSRFSEQAYESRWDSLLVRPQRERDALIAERDALIRAGQDALALARQLVQERDALKAERDTLQATLDRFLTGPSLQLSDVLALATRQIADNEAFPQDTRWVRCVNAQYRSGNKMWVVTCEFRVNKDDSTPVTTRTYTLNDQSGLLVR